MKKFTFMLLAAFMAAVIYADAARPARTMADRTQTCRAMMQTATGKTTPMRTAKKAATLPESATAEEYTLSYTDYYGQANYGTVFVAFDGTDVYMKGVCTYLPEAWIQGKLSDNTITFEANQSFGTLGNYEFFFQEEDAVFQYDATAGTLSLQGELYTYYDNYYGDYYVNPVLTRVVEKAGTPANPVITGIEATEYGDVVMFVVPTVDAEGNGMATGKLTYQFYVEANGEVSPLTFQANDYQRLTEDLTVIPFGFTEDYDIYQGMIYLNMDHSKWTKIGIKSTYTGGGETHETEIQWFEIEQGSTPVENNGTWVAAEQGYENSEEVTGINIGEGVNGLFDKGEGSLAPKYYENGTALRMYAGNTLTITSTEPLTEIVFTFDTRKDPAFEVSTGTIEIEGATGTWTGEATSIVFSVPNVSGTQTRIQQIVIGEGGDTPEPELVVLPEGVTPEAFAIDAKGEIANEEGETDSFKASKSIQVAFDGNDIYVQGLSLFFPEAWVKGTITGETAVFKTGQLYGTDEDGSIYFVGVNNDMEISDVVFDYDPETRTLACNSYILENAYTNKIGYYAYYTSIKIYPGDPVIPTLVTLPEGLTAEEYHFAGTDSYFEDNLDYAVQVAISGNDVYMQGLSQSVPEAWVKGTLTDGKAVFASGQYMGVYESFFGDYEIYFGGATFDYDAEAGKFFSEEGFVTMADSYTWDELSDVTITKVIEREATPATPQVVKLQYDDEYGYYLTLNIPLIDTEGNYMLSSKLSYQLYYEKDGNVEEYVLNPDDYEYLDKEMTVIPYTFTDDWDIYYGGEEIYLYGDVSSWTKVGVKAIYTGEGKAHESPIAWYDIDWTYSGVDKMKAAEGTTTYYDLQGRKADASAHGLLIRQTRMADGSVKCQKVMRK